MKKIGLTIITIICIISAFIVLNGCKKNTATVSFVNQSTTNTTYNVLMDGSTLCTIAPGATSSTYTVITGVTYNILFTSSTTGKTGCGDTYTPTGGQSQSYSCSF